MQLHSVKTLHIYLQGFRLKKLLQMELQASNPAKLPQKLAKLLNDTKHAYPQQEFPSQKLVNIHSF
jgi:hypothetical protein